MQDKVNVVLIKNPFNPSNKEIIEVDYEQHKTIEDYLPKESGVEYLVTLDGKSVDKEDYKSLIPHSNSYLVVHPNVAGGSNGILGILLSIVLVVAAAFLAPIISGALGIAGTGAAWSIGTQIVFGTLMAVGGMLLSSMMTPNMDTDLGDSSSSPTYGWGGIQSVQGQGYPIAVTYGDMVSGGVLIAKHITTDGTKQYLNLLYCAGEGELTGITDIKIDDNPIGNYDGVSTEIRYGTNIQDVISNFVDTYADQELAYLLNADPNGYGAEDGWSTQQLEGGANEGIEVILQLSSGLYHTKDNGDQEATHIKYEIQYREVGTSSWYGFGTGDAGEGPGIYYLNACYTESTFITRAIRNLPPAKYEVRARCLDKDGVKADGSISFRYANKLYWVTVSGIVTDDFTYPGKALIGIKALATDQLSGGLPQVTWKQSRSFVYVWDGGSYVQKPANNPAWAAYDILHFARLLEDPYAHGTYKMLVRGNPVSRLDYSKFSEWADFCDLKNITFNYIFDAVDDIGAQIAKVELMGRGKVLRKGTVYSPVWDDVSVVSQQFTMGNINKKSFRQEYLPIKDRANAIEITYFDKDKGYQRAVVMVYDSEFDADDAVSNITQVTFEGCTNLQQAISEGRYRLNMNKYLIRTIYFEADIEAITCSLGDVFNFQHDVLLTGSGGRILTASSTTVTLDREVTMEDGKTYVIKLTPNDGTEPYTMPVVTQVGTVQTILIDGTLSPIPDDYSVYAFGESTKCVKPYRVIEVSRSGDLKRTIAGIEYVPEIYTELDTYPSIEISGEDATNISSLKVNDTMNSAGVVTLNISWSVSRVKNYAGAIVLIDGIKVATVGASESKFIYQITQGRAYSITVRAVTASGRWLPPVSINYSPTSFNLDIITGVDAFTDEFDNVKIVHNASENANFTGYYYYTQKLTQAEIDAL